MVKQFFAVLLFLFSVGILSADLEWRASGVKTTRSWAIAVLLSYAVMISTIATTAFYGYVQSKVGILNLRQT